jgi:hypothetical protein
MHMFTIYRHTIRCLLLYNIASPCGGLQWVDETFKSVETSLMQKLEILVRRRQLHEICITLMIYCNVYKSVQYVSIIHLR